MKKLIALFMCLLFCSILFCQNKDNHKIDENPDSAFLATISILNDYDYLCKDGVGNIWYKSKKSEPQINGCIKNDLLIYLPKFNISHNDYKNVVAYEKILLDCRNKRYKILKIVYHYNYTEDLKTYDYPNSNRESDFISILPDTPMSLVITRTCN